MSSKIRIGTVKFGIKDYGFSKNTSYIDFGNFLKDALKKGIEKVDTSPRYGDSEKIIGNLPSQIKNKLSISTKIDEINIHSKSIKSDMYKKLHHSLRNLNLSTIDTLYLHQNELEVISNQEVMLTLKGFKQRGLIQEIGTSVYDKEELNFTLQADIYDWVQIPVNVLDTSFIEATLKKKNNTKIAARSVFLQGIIFDDRAIEKNVKQGKDLIDYLKKIKEICKKYNESFRMVALAFVSQIKEVDEILIGTTSTDNLEMNCHAVNSQINIEMFNELNALSLVEKSWSNPRDW